MPIISGRKNAERVIERVRERGASMAIFCTASHWNTEAILLAAKKFCDRYGVESVPVAVAMTFNYPYMPQAQRITRADSAKLGFLSIMEHLYILANDPDSPYRNIEVLPHLDHADPERDLWALTEGTEYLASAMFDMQRYPAEKNIAMTAEYVRNYGPKLLVEGIMEELVVSDLHTKGYVPEDDRYPEKALDYVRRTGIDFLVADLGTEQQSAGAGSARYLRGRAETLTRVLERKMLVLHGTSSLDETEMSGLAADGVVRVNMWTKIARESGQYAAQQLLNRAGKLFRNDFEAAESHQYLIDSIDKASDMMLEVLELLNYRNFGGAA